MNTTKLKSTARNLISAILSAVTRFESVVSFVGYMFLYVTFVVPPPLWVGSVSRDSTYQNGGPVLRFLSNGFWTHIAMPLAPLIGAFFLFSVVVWIAMRTNRELSHNAFKAVVASLFVLGLLFLVPVRSDYFAHQVEEYRSAERARFTLDRRVVVDDRTQHELMKIYRVLDQAGIATWRKDPIKVVEYELREGSLRGLHQEDDEVTMMTLHEDEESDYSWAWVELKNGKYHKMIDLQSIWSDDEHRVWLISSYRDHSDVIVERMKERGVFPGDR